jgi:hypothetical protein
MIILDISQPDGEHKVFYKKYIILGIPVETTIVATCHHGDLSKPDQGSARASHLSP